MLHTVEFSFSVKICCSFDLCGKCFKCERGWIFTIAPTPVMLIEIYLKLSVETFCCFLDALIAQWRIHNVAAPEIKSRKMHFNTKLFQQKFTIIKPHTCNILLRNYSKLKKPFFTTFYIFLWREKLCFTKLIGNFCKIYLRRKYFIFITL